jgi:hypothetical protein
VDDLPYREFQGNSWTWKGYGGRSIMSKEILNLVALFFVGSLVVLAVTHAKGFSTAAGTLFTGVNNLGTTLTGQRIKAGE